MDGPDSPEQRERKNVVVESPEFIDAGKNFYDQDPFSRIITITSTKTQLESDELRSLLNKSVDLSKDQFEVPNQAGFGFNRAYIDIKQLSKDQINLISKKVAIEMTYVKHMNGSYQSNLQTISAMLTVLNKYPFWISYVDSQSRAYHAQNGNPILNSPKEPPQIKSYGAWARERLEKEGFLKTKGIEEIFPQDIQGEKINDVVSGTGESKKWVLLNASELVK